MTTAEKNFVITHVFDNVSSMKNTVCYYSPIEEHCKVPWKITVRRNADHLEVFLSCLQEKKDREWSIDVWKQNKITAVNGKTHSTHGNVIFKNTDTGSGWGLNFIKWEDMMKNYVVDDTLKVEIRVTIIKTTGINLRKFDESAKELSDVVLVVENQKFYVSKLYLASQSSFFKSLLLKLSESQEHTLENINAHHFQKFLELLHGENPISDATIKGITHLADIYGAKIAIEKCEKFLIESSKKPLKEKLHLAHLYKLEKLKIHCLSKISTVSEIRLVLSEDLSEMDPVVSGALLQKFMANYEGTLKDLFRLTVILGIVCFVLFSLCCYIVGRPRAL